MPIAAMPPYLGPIWKRCLETHEALLDWLAQFPEDRFTWRPAPAARTAAEIIVHIARGDCRYAECLNPNAPARPEFAGPGMEASTVPGGLIPTDRDAARRVVKLAFDFSAGVVSNATEADLERVAADDWAPLGPLVEGPLTGLWFIEQMNRHKAYHLGQLWYLATMLEEAPAG